MSLQEEEGVQGAAGWRHEDQRLGWGLTPESRGYRSSLGTTRGVGVWGVSVCRRAPIYTMTESAGSRFGRIGLGLASVTDSSGTL